MYIQDITLIKTYITCIFFAINYKISMYIEQMLFICGTTQFLHCNYKEMQLIHLFKLP